MKAILKKACLLALALTVLGAISVQAKKSPFVPSIEQKGAPDVVEAIDNDGDDVTSWIVVTPYSEKHTLDDEKAAHFMESHSEADLKEFFAQLEAVGGHPVSASEELQISDLFYVHEFEDRGLIDLPVTIRLETNLPPHAFLAVYAFVDGEWVLVPSVDNGDGTVTITIDHWGPIAFVTHQKKESHAVTSPQTGMADPLPWIVLGGAAGYVLLRKRDEA